MNFFSVILCCLCSLSLSSALPKELLGRVEEIAIAQRNAPYPDQVMQS
jgi:hypothetical protein